MMYLTYNDYVELGGTLPETIFYDLATEAATVVDDLTFCRLQNEKHIDHKVKLLMYKLINLLQLRNDSLYSKGGEGGVIKSQSNDGVSITYGGMDAKAIYDIAQENIHTSIKNYLRGVRDSKGRLVLYRGIYSDE